LTESGPIWDLPTKSETNLVVCSLFDHNTTSTCMFACFTKLKSSRNNTNSKKCTDSSKIKQSKNWKVGTCSVESVGEWEKRKRRLFSPIERNRRYPLKAPLRFLEIREKSISYLRERERERERERRRRRRRRVFRRRCEGYVELGGGGNSKSREAQTHFPRKRYWHRLRNKNAVVSVWLIVFI